MRACVCACAHTCLQFLQDVHGLQIETKYSKKDGDYTTDIPVIPDCCMIVLILSVYQVVFSVSFY
jgi:hypothetical protein